MEKIALYHLIIPSLDLYLLEPTLRQVVGSFHYHKISKNDIHVFLDKGKYSFPSLLDSKPNNKRKFGKYIEQCEFFHCADERPEIYSIFSVNRIDHMEIMASIKLHLPSIAILKVK